MAGGGFALPGSSSTKGEWTGVARIKGPPWARMPLLTIGMLGLQIVWSVEMGYASPYLLSLGLSKSLMSIVFVAGPLSGLIVQPLIGVLADHSKSRFGRRRPFMLGGSLICVGGIILLGFTKSFSGIFLSAGTRAFDLLTIAFAVWSIYCIDFSINAVQAADRAILVDLLPPSQQEVGNAWAGRMFGLGSVAGFFVGNIDLPKSLPFLGDSQLKVLSILTGIFLMATQGLTAFSVTEKVLVSEAGGRGRGSFTTIIKDIWKNILTLPRVILQICIIQFFSWIAWFPVLFFSTTWVGEIYRKQAMAADSSLIDDAALQADATRAGSRALLWSSILSLGASIILPFLVRRSSFDESDREKDWRTTRKSDWSKVLDVLKGWRLHLATLWMVSQILFSITMGLTLFSTSVESASALITLTGFSWAVSQWVPFSLLGEAILVASPRNRYDPNDDTPIPLADHRTSHERAQLMFNAEDEDEHDDSTPPNRSYSPPAQLRKSSSSETRVRSPFGNPDATMSGADLHSMHDIHLTPQHPSMSRQTSNAPQNSAGVVSALERGGKEDHSDLASESDEGEGVSYKESSQSHADDGGMSEKAGIMLGIHNIFVVIPQFLVTGISSILFALLEPHKSVLDQGHAGHPHAGSVPIQNATDVSAAAADLILMAREAPEVAASGDSIGIIFRIGGVSAAIAAVLCWKLSRELSSKSSR